MLDPSMYVNDATGLPWRGNSSYPDELRAISGSQVEAWRTQLPSEITRLIEFTAGPEMRLAGYALSSNPDTIYSDPAVLQEIARSELGEFSWRTDFEDALLD